MSHTFKDSPDYSPRPTYHAGAINEAIAASNRAGRRINGREARLIHSLLRGRA